MTASTSDPPPDGRTLAFGASPAVIHAALLPEDREIFVEAYSEALDAARSSLQLTPIHEVLEEWRRRAILQSDPQAFRRSVRKAAAFHTGRPVPDDEPFEVTRAHSGL